MVQRAFPTRNTLLRLVVAARVVVFFESVFLCEAAGGCVGARGVFIAHYVRVRKGRRKREGDDDEGECQCSMEEGTCHFTIGADAIYALLKQPSTAASLHPLQPPSIRCCPLAQRHFIYASRSRRADVTKRYCSKSTMSP